MDSERSSPIDQASNALSLIKPVETGRDREAAPMVLRLGGDGKPANEFSFSLAMHAVRQRIYLGLALGIVATAAACAIIWAISEEKFKSKALLTISDRAPYLAYPTHEHSNAFAQTQIELLKSNVIVESALQQNGLIERVQRLSGRNVDPVEWVTKCLKVGPLSRSELYEVSVTTTEPATSQKLAEAIVDAYMTFRNRHGEKRRTEILELLNDELKTRKEMIDQKRKNLRDLNREIGGENLLAAESPEGVDGLAGPLEAIGRAQVIANLKERLVDAQLEIVLESANVKLAERDADAGRQQKVSAADLHVALGNHHVVRQIRKQIESENSRLQVMSKDARKTPEVHAKLEKLKQQLEEAEEKHRPEVEEDLRAELESRLADVVKDTKEKLANQKEIVKMLQEQILQERKEQADVSDKVLAATFAKDELEAAEEVAQRISDRTVHLKTEGRAPDQVEIVQAASLPEFPDGPSLTKKLIMFGGAALLAPLALLVGWDLAYKRVFQREQLLREVDVKVVSEIAALPTRSMMSGSRGDKAFQQQARLFEESVNALRTTLSIDPGLEHARVFVLSSAVSGEGKTNLSSQLAMSWAQCVPGKVLIVDADLRAPNIHELFEVEPRPGLAEVLRGECSLEEAIVMDWGGSLFILPAGDAKSRSPSQLFSQSRLREIIQKLRSQYLRVVIDVPPVLCASETLQIAKEADGTLICALRDYSRGGQIKDAYDRLKGSGANVVGAVLNGTPVRQYSYYYRGYAPT